MPETNQTAVRDTQVIPSTRPILVIGTSHTTAIAAALTEHDREKIDVVNIGTFFGPMKGRGKVLDPKLSGMFAPQRIFCSFGGSEHNVLGLMETPAPFDFHSDASAQLGADRSAVPRAVIRRTLLWRMEKWLALASETKSMFGVPVTHICSPPPFLAIDETTRLPSDFVANISMGVAPADLRRKLHELHTEIAREHMKAAGIDFLPFPPEAVDEEGYLKHSLWSRDPTHGNADYGKLVLRQIQEMLRCVATIPISVCLIISSGATSPPSATQGPLIR